MLCTLKWVPACMCSVSLMLSYCFLPSSQARQKDTTFVTGETEGRNGLLWLHWGILEHIYEIMRGSLIG